MDKAIFDEDRAIIVSAKVPGVPCWTVGSVKISTTPFLSAWAFPDSNFAVTIAAVHGSYLFFFDSAGLYAGELPGVKQQASTMELRQLLPEGDESPVTMIAVKNSDAGPHALRGRMLTAQSIAVAAPFMGDHMNVVTRAAGQVDGAFRYVSFSNGRMRQSASKFQQAEARYAWCGDVAAELKQGNTGAKLFGRFATPIEPPADPTPLNILFDLGQFANTFSENVADQGIKIEDACISIDPDAAKTADGHAFALTINGQQKIGWIAWSPDKQAYAITSKHLERIKQVDDRRVTLVRRINQKQPFRIIPATSGVVYAYGDFYSTDLKLGGRQGAGRAILDLLEVVPALAGLKSEKGHFDGHAPGWPDDSVFGFIDQNLVANAKPGVFGERFRVLVCDDLRDETADFIALDDDRLVLIHAKASLKGNLYGASALQDVFSQAVKNLAFIKSDSQELPKDRGKWNRPWSISENGKTASTTRIRCGATTSAEIREQIRSIRFRPGTKRQVWIVLGNLLSRSALGRSARSGQATA